ncbi:unnamed protein product, partial [Staurois parvus]
MQDLGKPDIVNAGSGETRYSECRVCGFSNTLSQGRGEKRHWSVCGHIWDWRLPKRYLPDCIV